jgi:hypothetical protein
MDNRPPGKTEMNRAELLPKALPPVKNIILLLYLVKQKPFIGGQMPCLPPQIPPSPYILSIPFLAPCVKGKPPI